MYSWRIPIVLLMLVACGAVAEVSETTPLVVVVTKGSSGEFWQSVRAGASDAAKEEKAYLEWPSTFSQNELAGQAQVVKQAVAFAQSERRPFALVVDPLYGSMFADLFHGWQLDYGLALVTFDEDVVREQDRCAGKGRSVSFVGTQNEKAGRRAGEYLAAELNGKGKVAMLRLNPGVGTTTLRERGFLQAMSHFPDIEVLFDNYYWAMNLDVDSAYRESRMLLRQLASAEEDPSSVLSVVESLGENRGLKHLKGEKTHQLDGVFTSNESTTVGMLRALEDADLTDEITFVGFDSNPLLENALLLEKINALVVQDPHEMGKLSVERALELVKLGEEEIKRLAREDCMRPVYTPFRVATREKLEICRAEAQQSKNAKFQKFIHKLEARSSILSSFLSKESSAPYPGPEACDRKMLKLLFPDPKIWHLQSRGRAG